MFSKIVHNVLKLLKQKQASLFYFKLYIEKIYTKITEKYNEKFLNYK